jgi:adenosylcobyric acid synthase
MPAKVLMIQGVSSSAGKSLLTAGLCRLFHRKGIRVAPFKAQNMSNNSAVCGDGCEIGRAQAVQAFAAGIEPAADMNPVLLKPEADSRSQVVVMGRPWKTLRAASYYKCKEELWPVVTAALDRLRAGHDLVLIEGAGSPVELNLRSMDLVNMALAKHAGAPVLLVGDIDRGGIFAQLLGTLWLLQPEERALVRGLVVNKFRGDMALFADGVRILEERGGVPVLGVIPFLPGIALPEEDSVALETATQRPVGATVDIAVIRLPHIANFDDFDPLTSEPGIAVRYVDNVAALGLPHAIILPGTKSTLADLAWLRSQGIAEAIRVLAARGTSVAGICGGYQMLGQVIRDPSHVESMEFEAPGLGLLPVETTFETGKATFQVSARLRNTAGWLAPVNGLLVEGYEIHMGQTVGGQGWLQITCRNGAAVDVADGAMSPDGRIWGCYLHGIFGNEHLRRAWLRSLSAPSRINFDIPATNGQPSQALLNYSLDRLADAVECALDMRRLEGILSAFGKNAVGQPF